MKISPHILSDKSVNNFLILEFVRIRIGIRECFKGIFNIARHGVFQQSGSYLGKTQSDLHKNVAIDVVLDNEVPIEL